MDSPHIHTHTHTFTHSITLTLPIQTRTHTHSHTHAHIHTLNHSNTSNTNTHSHTHTLPHARTHSHTHTPPECVMWSVWDMIVLIMKMVWHVEHRTNPKGYFSMCRHYFFCLSSSIMFSSIFFDDLDSILYTLCYKSSYMQNWGFQNSDLCLQKNSLPTYYGCSGIK